MRMILITLLLAITFRAYCPEYRTIWIDRAERIQPYEAIWRAVCLVESSGNRFAYHLESNGTESLGIAQIQDCRVQEYNRLAGKLLKHTDVYSPDVSKSIFMFYANRYGTYRTDDFIRSWNGSGSATYKYLKKVKTLVKQ